jgi:hypothetical protein
MRLINRIIETCGDLGSPIMGLYMVLRLYHAISYPTKTTIFIQFQDCFTMRMVAKPCTIIYSAL